MYVATSGNCLRLAHEPAGIYEFAPDVSTRTGSLVSGEHKLILKLLRRDLRQGNEKHSPEFRKSHSGTPIKGIERNRRTPPTAVTGSTVIARPPDLRLPVNDKVVMTAFDRQVFIRDPFYSYIIEIIDSDIFWNDDFVVAARLGPNIRLWRF